MVNHFSIGKRVKEEHPNDIHSEDANWGQNVGVTRSCHIQKYLSYIKGYGKYISHCVCAYICIFVYLCGYIHM